MKKILLLLLFPFLCFSQTSISTDDIYAAAGNRFETLLTNVEAGDNWAAVSSLLDRMGMTLDEKYKPSSNLLNQRIKFIQKIVSGNEKTSVVFVTWVGKWVKGYQQPIITKVEIEGNTQSIITFYVNFWTRAINFRDTKPGETVTTRFLSDVAALSVGTNGQSKIVVTTAKDYYK